MLTVGRSVGRLDGRSVGRSVGRLVGWMVGRLVGRSVGWSVGRLVGWSGGWSVGRSVGRLVGWSVGRVYFISCILHNDSYALFIASFDVKHILFEAHRHQQHSGAPSIDTLVRAGVFDCYICPSVSL